MAYDWLIVGAGFAGAVLAERIASQLDQRVLLVDRRDHIGGNCYDAADEAGILVHRYGPHAFHTNFSEVWNYLSGFTEWHPYCHRVLAHIDGQLVPVPFNLTSLERLFPPQRAQHLQRLLLETYGRDAHVPILRLREQSTGDLRDLADFIYEKLFRGYTTKQWGLGPQELAPSVTARVPIVVGHDDRHFRDKHQGIPLHGYTRLFWRLLSHRNIHLSLNTDYRDVLGQESFRRTIYTGAIDAFFDHMHGPLPYRSLHFRCQTHDRQWYQPVAQVNYPNDHAYTRITEYKHMTGQRTGRTTTVSEYPQAHEPGVTEAMYPIPCDQHRQQFALYQQEAAKLSGHVLFLGRLADYQYYNMDQVVARALTLFEQQIAAQPAAPQTIPPQADAA